MLPINKYLKRRAINALTGLGIDVGEIIIDIKISDMTINSIEYCKDINTLILHVFNDDLDMSFDFDCMSEIDRLKIVKDLCDI
jgi:hypothetical protein